MTVLLWIAVLVGGWCVASVVAALVMGTFLRHRREATDPEGALRPLAVGPLDLWVGVTPERPDASGALAGSPGPTLPAPRAAADEFARDPEGVG